MKAAARSEAEAESPLLFLAETTGFSPCVIHSNVFIIDLRYTNDAIFNTNEVF